MPLSPDVEDFAIRSEMPYEDVAELDAKHPGFLQAALDDAMSEIYSRLGKRYKRPMVPVPGIVKKWRTKLVTPQAYSARGRNAQDPSVDDLDAEADRARDQMKEAADSVTGLWDLPLADSGDATAISKGGPLTYSEPTPYEWLDVQMEERNGGR